MAEATLPLVGVQTYDHTMGELHGYRTQMDACYMRDALIPLDSKRKMDLTINTYGYDVDSVSYEVRSLDTQRKIADTKVSDWNKDGNTWTKSLQIENLVDEGQEYLFILKLHCKSDDLYYYTRITLPEETYAKKCLEFTDSFHNVSMSDQYELLASYIEPADYTDKNDLGNVNINSSIDRSAGVDLQANRWAIRWYPLPTSTTPTLPLSIPTRWLRRLTARPIIIR